MQRGPLDGRPWPSPRTSPNWRGPWIGGVRATLPGSMAAYQPDGAYPEGPAYWAYGTTFDVVILAELEGCLGTDFGLGKAPASDRTALYRLAVQGPTGLGFNYADGDAAINDSDDRGLAPYAWLAQRYHWTSALWHSRELIAQEAARRGENGDRFLAMDAVWYPAAPDDSAKSEPLDMHFRGRADIALFRSSWGDRRALFVGFKAGDNATNHAHLDLGSFVLDADGVRWAESLGSDNYNLPEYFGAKRWTAAPRLNNHSQNTLTPGDRLQEATAVAPIVAFGSSPARACRRRPDSGLSRRGEEDPPRVGGCRPLPGADRGRAGGGSSPGNAPSLGHGHFRGHHLPCGRTAGRRAADAGRALAPRGGPGAGGRASLPGSAPLGAADDAGREPERGDPPCWCWISSPHRWPPPMC